MLSKFIRVAAAVLTLLAGAAGTASAQVYCEQATNECGGGGGAASEVESGVTGITGGADNQVCYNEPDTLECGSSTFTFDKAAGTLTVSSVVIPSAPAAATTGFYIGPDTSRGAIQAWTDNTPDALVFNTGSASNSLLVYEFGDIAFDFQNGPCGTSACTDPTLIIHSHNHATDEYAALDYAGLHFGTGGAAGGSFTNVDDGYFALRPDAGTGTTRLYMGGGFADGVTFIQSNGTDAFYFLKHSNGTAADINAAAATFSGSVSVSGNQLAVADQLYLTHTSNNLTDGAVMYTGNTYPETRIMAKTYNWDNADIVGLGATTSADILVTALKDGQVVKNVFVVVRNPASNVTTLTISCGRTGAAYIDYIVASDAKAAANTIYGNDSAERGTNNTGYDFVVFSGATDIKCQFISTGGNLADVLDSSGQVIIEYTRVPSGL